MDAQSVLLLTGKKDMWVLRCMRQQEDRMQTDRGISVNTLVMAGAMLAVSLSIGSATTVQAALVEHENISTGQQQKLQAVALACRNIFVKTKSGHLGQRSRFCYSSVVSDCIASSTELGWYR